MDGFNNKVDMSLDEIIKLNKKEKKQTLKVSSGSRGRGGKRGVNRGGRGGGKFASRGIGRGVAQQGGVTAQNTTVQKKNMQDMKTKRGALSGGRGVRGRRGGGARGRGVVMARGRGGRGRGLVSTQKQNTGVGLLTKKAANAKAARGRGRGQRVFTNSKLGNNGNTLQDQRRQRLNVVKAQAKLIRSKEVALKNLRTAKKNMQDINKALKMKPRDDVVNAKRGIITNTAQNMTIQPVGRGGRRKLLTGLMSQNFKGSNMSLASNASGRQMINTSVTIANRQAANQKSKNRRPFRGPRNNSSNVSIQVANTANQSFKAPVSQPKPIIEQLKLLKPAVPTTYKFQKNVFSTSSTTTVSLNDRFSSSSTSLSYTDNGERKVYI